MENGEYLITEKCKELKREVQLAKEEKIEEINQLSESLFLKIDTYEEKCKNIYKEISKFRNEYSLRLHNYNFEKN
jgi:chaperonin cofactor prefoldin